MKKRSLTILMAFAMMMCFSACSDDALNSGGGDNPVSPTEPETDYTVIFWGMGGGNDIVFVDDMYDLQTMRCNGTIGDNVKLYGTFKISQNSHLKELVPYGYEGTYNFHLGDTVFIDKKSIQAKGGDVAYRAKVLESLNFEKCGGNDYPLTNTDSLSNFIKKAVAKYPAKKYVLMLYGHGDGYKPYQELPISSRGCVLDDMLNDTSIIADNLVAAVNNSGVKISAIFFQCCLMATWENLAAYRNCTDFALASAESTMGGYLQHFISYISNGEPTDESIKESLDKTVDYYADKYKKSLSSGSSHGRYDLRETDSIMSIIKSIGEWYSDAYDKDSTFITDAVLKTVFCSSGYSDLQENYNNFLAKRSSQTAMTLDEIKAAVDNTKALKSRPNEYGYLLPTLMKYTLDNRDKTTVRHSFSSLQKLYNNYMTQLKSMAYIGASKANDDIADYAYIFTSPTINIFTLNEKDFKPMGLWNYYLNGSYVSDDAQATLQTKLDKYAQAIYDKDTATENALYQELFEGCAFARHCDYDTVLKNYTSSQFDKATGWSNFLKKIRVNPSYSTNHTRFDYDNIKIFEE